MFLYNKRRRKLLQRPWVTRIGLGSGGGDRDGRQRDRQPDSAMPTLLGPDVHQGVDPRLDLGEDRILGGVQADHVRSRPNRITTLLRHCVAPSTETQPA